VHGFKPDGCEVVEQRGEGGEGVGGIGGWRVVVEQGGGAGEWLLTTMCCMVHEVAGSACCEYIRAQSALTHSLSTVRELKSLRCE
jgi:hypothetical protein